VSTDNLFVVVHCNRRLRQLGLKELPEVGEVLRELQTQTSWHDLL